MDLEKTDAVWEIADERGLTPVEADYYGGAAHPGDGTAYIGEWAAHPGDGTAFVEAFAVEATARRI